MERKGQNGQCFGPFCTFEQSYVRVFCTCKVQTPLYSEPCQIPYRYKEGRDRKQDVSPMSIAHPSLCGRREQICSLFLPLPPSRSRRWNGAGESKEVLINRILRPSIHSLGGARRRIPLSWGKFIRLPPILSFALSPRV